MRKKNELVVERMGYLDIIHFGVFNLGSHLAMPGGGVTQLKEAPQWWGLGKYKMDDKCSFHVKFHKPKGESQVQASPTYLHRHCGSQRCPNMVRFTSLAMKRGHQLMREDGAGAILRSLVGWEKSWDPWTRENSVIIPWKLVKIHTFRFGRVWSEKKSFLKLVWENKRVCQIWEAFWVIWMWFDGVFWLFPSIIHQQYVSNKVILDQRAVYLWCVGYSHRIIHCNVSASQLGDSTTTGEGSRTSYNSCKYCEIFWTL